MARSYSQSDVMAVVAEAVAMGRRTGTLAVECLSDIRIRGIRREDIRRDAREILSRPGCCIPGCTARQCDDGAAKGIAICEGHLAPAISAPRRMDRATGMCHRCGYDSFECGCN